MVVMDENQTLMRTKIRKTLGQISEISEITTAATNNPKFAKCEISEIRPPNSQTDDGLNSEITLNSQNSKTSQRK